ncbi:MAG: DUF3078 domain-containing protein [Bacteroidales bacterium]|nr:DUF3078 domain-containing protein [Candidatus Cryptobacteroides equifaecalis]
MKRLAIFTFAAAFAFQGLAYAQDDVLKAAAAAVAAGYENGQKEEEAKPSNWIRFIDTNLGFNQTGLFNWAAGGYSTITLSAGLDAQAKYTKDLMTWNNRLQLNYGFLWSQDKVDLIQKSNDRIYLESRWGYKTAPTSKWNYTASFDFRTQFTNSRTNYAKNDEGKWNGDLKSGFLSPAYANIALGMEWVPVQWFNINLAPVTGSLNMCTIPELRKSYGMPEIATGEYGSALFQLGMQVKMNFKVTFNDVLNYETQFVWFTDYLNRPFRNNRINWDNKISWKLAKYFVVGLDTWLIYDPLVKFKDEPKSKVQFKEFLSVNFSYTFGSKTKK